MKECESGVLSKGRTQHRCKSRGVWVLTLKLSGVKRVVCQAHMEAMFKPALHAIERFSDGK